jgi:hypothetical protein
MMLACDVTLSVSYKCKPARCGYTLGVTSQASIIYGWLIYSWSHALLMFDHISRNSVIYIISFVTSSHIEQYNLFMPRHTLDLH